MKHIMKNVYTIKELINLFSSRILLIIVLTLFGGAAAFGYTNFMMPLKYSSHITMYVQSYTGITENNTKDVNNISNSKKLVNTYMEVLKDNAVMNAVGDLLIEQYDFNELARLLDVKGDSISPDLIRSTLLISAVADTSAINVIATTSNAKLAADICNDLTLVAPKYIKEAVGVGSVNTIGKAKIYRTPVSSNNIRNFILGMLTAFLFAFSIILIMDYLDNTIKDSSKISKNYDKAFIGTIQRFSGGKKLKHRASSSCLITDENMPFNVVEGFKTIRTNICFTAADSEKKVIAVSSSNPNDGKSTSAANLAIALAQNGNSVLLIDGDLRKAVLHKLFQINNDEGLSTLIIKKSSIDKSVKRDVIKNLDLLPSGPLPPNPSELIASGNFRALLKQMSNNYDYIIIDTPPINVVSDAISMKDGISGILLVIRYATTTYEELSNCMKQIDLAQVNMLGFLMNDVHRKWQTQHGNHKYQRNYGLN